MGTAGVGGRCDGQRGESVGVPGGGARLSQSGGWGRRRGEGGVTCLLLLKGIETGQSDGTQFSLKHKACACLLDFTWSWRARACTPAQFAPFPADTTTWGLCCKLE